MSLTLIGHQTEHRNAGAGEGNLYPLKGVREELI